MNKSRFEKTIVTMGLAAMLTVFGSYGAVKADAASTYKTIIIKKGDTLFSLAKKYKTTVKKIQSLNKMKSTRIYAGKKLKIPTAIVTAKTAKQYYAELEKSKVYSTEEKRLIKESKLIDYVVSTYKGKMDIKEYDVFIPAEQPPSVDLILKEKGTNLSYIAGKELIGDESEFIWDTYIVNQISYGARKLAAPTVQDVFKKKSVEYITNVRFDHKVFQKLTAGKLKSDYPSVKKDSTAHIYLLLPDTKEYKQLALDYMKAQAKSTKIKMYSYDLFFYSGKKPTKNDESLKYVRVEDSKLSEYDTIEAITTKLEDTNMGHYKEAAKWLVKQTSLYR